MIMNVIFMTIMIVLLSDVDVNVDVSRINFRSSCLLMMIFKLYTSLPVNDDL